MKRNVLKILVSVLVLALLLQVPFALSASASTLSEGTSYKFLVTGADEGAPGNTLVKLYATTDENELITTFGATLVINTEEIDLVNNAGEVVTDTYKSANKQLGESFPLSAAEVDEGESFVFLPSCSLASYNSTTGEMYLFISGLSVAGLSVAENSELASFYLQAKEGVTPSVENIRLMMLSEYKNAEACPSASVAPGEISSKATVFEPAAENIVTNLDLEFDVVKYGTVTGTINGDNNTADITVELKNGNEVVATQVVKGAEAVYNFDAVLPGTYTIAISSPGSLGFTVNNVVVTAENETVVLPVYLLFGDCNEDGTITAQDISNILTEFGENSTSTSDVDGSGTVTAQDIGVIILANHFGIGAASQVIDL